MDLTDLQPMSITSGILGFDAAREACHRLSSAFLSTPSGAEVVINVGSLHPPAGIDADTWVDADRRFHLWLEGAPHVLPDWKATCEGRSPWAVSV